MKLIGNKHISEDWNFFKNNHHTDKASKYKYLMKVKTHTDSRYTKKFPNIECYLHIEQIIFSLLPFKDIMVFEQDKQNISLDTYLYSKTG